MGRRTGSEPSPPIEQLNVGMASCNASVTRYGIASTDELLDLAIAWEKWGDDPTAFFAFAWCRVLAWC